MSKDFAQVLALAAMLFSMAVSSEPTSDDQAWIDRSLEIIRDSESRERPDWLTTPKPTPQQQAAIEDITHMSLSIAERTISAAQSSHPVEEVVSGDTIYLFISLSMGEYVLRDVMEALAHHKNLQIVLRGLPGSASDINQAAAWMHNLLKGLDDKPHLSLDPTKFAEYGVTTVPTLVIEQNGQFLASAKGVTSVNWLSEQIDAGKEGDLGVHGEIFEIAEQDLIEVMKKRAEAIDWDKKKTAARNNYWPRQTAIALAVTTEPSEFTIDPSFRVTADIMAPNGQIIAAKGTLINPLDRLPFNQKLIIFDGGDESQIDVALAEAASARASNLIPKFIVTRHAAEPSWENIQTLEDRLNSPFTVLNNSVVQRFQIKRIPSTIEADGKVFVIREIQPGA